MYFKVTRSCKKQKKQNKKKTNKQKKHEFIIYIYALRIIQFLSNLSGAAFTQCLVGIKYDEVKIINAITKSEINFNVMYKVKLFVMKEKQR